MHELPIVQAVVKTSLEYAQAHEAKQIHKITLLVGELHDFVPIWAEKFFAYIAKGTIAENAKLEIEFVPIVCQCKSCEEKYILHLHDPEETQCCPVCKSVEATKLSGDEFIIKNIEVS